MADASPSPIEARSPGSRAKRSGRVRTLWPYALIAFLDLATSPYHQGLNNPNEMVRVYMTKALVDDHTLSIDHVVRAWGGVDDKAIRDGHLYSSKAPLQSLIGVPIYAAAKPVFAALGIAPTKRAITTALRIVGAAIPGLLLSSLLLAWARRRAVELEAPAELGTALGLAAALGTMIYPYALNFTGHLLAALAAGGCHLGVIALARAEPRGREWRLFALLTGLAAGAAPFAEYPAALAALPALFAALFVTRTARARAELLVFLAIGGAAPFLLGLWSHDALWGSPLRTGYAFLENRAYVELHGRGFFGVAVPKPEAFAGALFSPGTGLFFFSPVLIIGLAALSIRTFSRPDPDPEPAPDPARDPERDGAGEAERARELARAAREARRGPIPRAIAIAGFVAFVLEVLFISGHQGWRGGWTLGPRYIIPVAPLLLLWTIEALGNRRLHGFIAAFASVSIVTTGFAAALYPHLSDVYTNPLRAFVFPSYLRGEASYGIAHALGLHGHLANAVHVVPLALAVGYAAFAGARGELRRRAAIVLVTFTAVLGIIAIIPERDRAAADRENQRLWGFWEPARPKAAPVARPGLVFDARPRWREVQVEAEAPGGEVRRCRLEPGDRCRYGDQPWQYFGPDAFEFEGERTPILFMHPIAGSIVRARFVRPEPARRGVLRYGLSDGAVESTNRDPVRLRILEGDRPVAESAAGNVRGLHTLDFALTSTRAPVSLEILSDQDGARVFGFMLELYRE